MKTIFHDTILNFGKYKGEDVLDVLDENPGYFLWLRESGTYDLDDEVTNAVNTWAADNGVEANAVIASARRSKRRAKAEHGMTSDNPKFLLRSAYDSESPTPASEPTIRNTNWGSW